MTLKELNIKQNSIIWIEDIEIFFNILRPNSWVELILKCKDWKSNIHIDIFYSPLIVDKNGGIWEENYSCLIKDIDNYSISFDEFWGFDDEDLEKNWERFEKLFGRSDTVEGLIYDVIEEFMPQLNETLFKE